MEAPEKIYIDDFGSQLSYDWHTEHSYKGDIEYVRKDVFIEKAWDWIENNILSSNQQDNSSFYFKQFVNHIKV